MWPFKKRKEKIEKEEEREEEVFSTYPDFPYHSGQLTAFLPSIEFFTISLKDGNIIHYHPKEYDFFFSWLVENNIQNIKKPL